jgi:hypothetical protein
VAALEKNRYFALVIMVCAPAVLTGTIGFLLMMIGMLHLLRSEGLGWRNGSLIAGGFLSRLSAIPNRIFELRCPQKSTKYSAAAPAFPLKAIRAPSAFNFSGSQPPSPHNTRKVLCEFTNSE